MLTPTNAQYLSSFSLMFCDGNFQGKTPKTTSPSSEALYEEFLLDQLDP
jgi:hypothetical protein